MVNVFGVMVQVKFLVFEPPTVKLAVTEEEKGELITSSVRVPVMTPEELMLNPAGKVADQEETAAVAVTVKLMLLPYTFD